MKSLFVALYDFFERRKAVLWAVLAGFFVLFGLLIMTLDFEEDISGVLNLDEDTKQYNTIIQSSQLFEKLILVVSSEDTVNPDKSKLTAFADSLAERLSLDDKGLIKRITLRVEEEHILTAYQLLMANLPLFLEEGDYGRFDSLFARENLRAALSRQLQSLSSPFGLITLQNLKYDPAGAATPFLGRLRDFQASSALEVSDGYLFSKDGKHLVFYLEPSNPVNETGENTLLIRMIEREAGALSSQEAFHHVRCRHFGSSAISVGNALQLQRDIKLTMLIAGVALLILFFTVFRRRRVPLLLLLTIAFGGAFSLAAIALLKSSVSLIAIGSGSVILGIVVHYPIHLLTHRLFEKDIRNVIRGMVVPLVIGSATTIGGFLCLLFMRADILRDLGLFGAFSLVGAVIFTLVFCPHMTAGLTAHQEGRAVPGWLTGIAGFSLENKRIPLLIILVLTPVFLWFAPRIKFESDLAELNYMSRDMKETEALLDQIQGGRQKSVYIISYGATREEALANSWSIRMVADSLKEKGYKADLSALVRIIPPVHIQKERIERWNAWWTQEKVDTVLKNLSQISAELGFTPDAFSPFIEQLTKGARLLDRESYDFLLDAFGKELILQKDSLFTLVTQVATHPDQQSQVADILSELPGNTVIDSGMISNHLLQVINDDFNLLAILTAAIVLLALLLSYGRIELVLVTFIPMLVAWVWVIGMMALLNIRFNLVNIVLSTFIFGLGDDFCIFVMDGMQQQNKTGKKHFTPLRIGIYLSAITAIIGFGVLLLARHPALLSIATVSILGILSVLFISQTLEPYLFNFLITKQQAKGRPPLTLCIIINSMFAFSHFTFGCIALSIIGILLLPFRCLNKKRVMFFYHRLLHEFTNSLVWIMSNVRKNYSGLTSDSFREPSILISNHQSVLDILLVITLNPRIILLTNNWVWNSPVFGLVVRLADYHPIVKGVETSISKLSKAVENGYSIAVFPEGTRSRTGKIQRFHKGAFYLAEKLSLDIIPVLIHGTGRTLPKGSFGLRNETISIRLLDRIHWDDPTFGATYQERTRKISRYFRQEHARYARERETPRYYRNQIISGYIYKGPVIEWYLKVKIRLEKDYEVFHSLVPARGRILDAGCGYGFMAHMLSLLSPERKIKGIDYDEEKTEVASHCYFREPNLTFEAADLQDYPLEGYDAILFSDVLHYLTPDERIDVLKRSMAGLNPGGSVIIRDGDAGKVRRQKNTKLTEWFSTRICRFNMTRNDLSFFRAADIMALADANGFMAKVIDNTRFTSNILIILTRKS